MGGSLAHQAAALVDELVRGEGQVPVTWNSSLTTDVSHHTGLIGFDVETGSRLVRPELRRLLKRRIGIAADDSYALAA
jgi:hypothetical protein